MKGYDRLLDFVASQMRGLSLLPRRAKSLNEGFEYLADNDIDLILLDPDLPDSSGIGTVMRVRGLVPEVPVVVITAHENEEMSLRLLKEGVHDCIFESQLRPSQLMRSLLYVVERNGWKEYVEKCNVRSEVRTSGIGPGAR
jgi:DNA-binding response OmpR family regulator